MSKEMKDLSRGIARFFLSLSLSKSESFWKRKLWLRKGLGWAPPAASTNTQMNTI